ncbi:hypothetical protein D3C81_1896840 [compost metagenome]
MVIVQNHGEAAVPLIHTFGIHLGRKQSFTIADQFLAVPVAHLGFIPADIFPVAVYGDHSHQKISGRKHPGCLRGQFAAEQIMDCMAAYILLPDMQQTMKRLLLLLHPLECRM